MSRTSILWVALSVSLGAACGLAERIDERIVVNVAGQDAARAQAEAAVAIQERLLEALTSLDAPYTGDAKWVLVPIAAQPGLGADVTAVTQPPVRRAPPSYDAAAVVTQTGYVAAADEGPDGTPGWYTRSAGGFVFYYKTLPEADLSQRWPENVQTLWAGWRGSGALNGQSWWIKSEVLAATHVRGEWEFRIVTAAAKYAGTRYFGSYDYARVPDQRVAIAVAGKMKHVNGDTTRESYARYAYAYTNATDAETGRFYFGVGPEVMLDERPAWAEGKNPAGEDWTNDTQRPGLFRYKVWTGQTSAWWTHDGTHQACSTTPSAIQMRGGGTVTIGRTLQLSADALSACKERLRYRTLRWASSNRNIAVVNDAGLVSGIAAGVTDVTANAGDAWGRVSVTVRELDLTPAKIYLTPGASVQVGGSLKLAATVLNKYDEPLAGVPVAWTSLNPAIAKVTGEGEVTGRADGTTTIRATAGSVTRERTLRVYDPSLVETLTLTCPTSRTLVGAAVQCAATAFSFNGGALAGTVFAWSSSNTAVLTVSATGAVTALAKGTATVTASANGRQRQVSFTVYDQNDVSYVVIASANGANLRFGDAAFKLALTAKAYNAAGAEIPGIAFTWRSENAAIAPVAAGPANSSAVSAGPAEGATNISATTPNAVVGTFAVGNWDNRISAIRIYDSAMTDVASLAMGYNAAFQLYVRTFNANDRALGYVTPAWTVPAGLAVNANGVLASATTPGAALVVQAAVPRGNGPGNATDTLTVTVYDALKPASLAGSCTSTYGIYAGGTLDCTVHKYNLQGAVIAGAPVTWYVSDPAKLAIVSQLDTGSPGSVQFQVPPALAAGGPVTFKAYAACNGAPQAPAFGNCVVSAEGTVNAHGTGDVNYVAIVAPASGTKIGIGDSALLVAKAYDHQDPPQELSGVAFTYTRQSGTSFSDPSAAGAVTATAEGITYFQATAAGGASSGSLGHALQGVDPARATVVTLASAPAALPTLRPYQAFTVWAAAANGLGQAIPAAAFTFATSNSRLEVMASTATTATLRFVRCDCANTATNSATVTATYAGAGGAQASRAVTVLNPVYNVAVNTPANTLVPEGAPFTVSVAVTGQDGQAAPAAATVALQEPGISPAFNVSGLDLVDLVFQNGNALTVNVFAEDASTASSRTTQWSFLINPTPVIMTGATTGSPALANGYLAKELYSFATAAAFDKAVTYATWATTGVVPDRTYTNVTHQALAVLSGGFYGLTKISTGEIVTSRIGVRMFGYVRSPSSTLYLRNQAWERVRVRLGGITVLEEWSTTAAAATRAVKLTNLPVNTWVPVEIFGLMNAAQTVNGQKLGYVLWSASGSSFADTPSTAGVTLAQDP